MTKKYKPIKVDKHEYDELCLSYMKKYKKPEEWRQVIVNGITTGYKISNYGRIINVDKNKIPSIRICNKHYRVYIKVDTGKYMDIGTYRLVAMMFINIPKKYLDSGYSMNNLVVDHIRDGEDDNFDDNTVWNLQWLTHRENTSKAAKCGYRQPFAIGFRDELDQMILDGYDNKSLYEFCENVYGYTKKEMKATIQVRRRRLGKTLKEHHERDKEFVKIVDSLILQGMSNYKIKQEIFFPGKNKSTDRFLQYRRSVLKVPSQTSKYLSNKNNKKMIELIKEGKTNKEIIEYFKFDKLDSVSLNKIKATIRTRRNQYKKQMQNNK